MRKGEKKGVYCVNHNYFKTWSHDMAYILGFMVADGNVQKVGNYVKAEVKPSDVSVLNFIRDEITPGYDLRQSRPSEIRWYPASRSLKSDLIKHGVVPAKTGKEIVPPKLPKKYLWDFIRGLFDGDGSVEDCLVYITSNSRSILADLMQRTGLGRLSRDRMNWKWIVEDKTELQQYRSQMYANGRFSFERKRKLFDYLMESQQFGKRRPFTASEDDYIKNNYHFTTRFALAMAMGRSGASVKNRLAKLSIKKV